MPLPEEKVVDIEIHDPSNPASPRTVRAIVAVISHGLASYRRAFFTDHRYDSRECDSVPLESCLFREITSEIRAAIKAKGQQQGWLDRHATVRMPYDQR